MNTADPRCERARIRARLIAGSGALALAGLTVSAWLDSLPGIVASLTLLNAAIVTDLIERMLRTRNHARRLPPPLQDANRPRVLRRRYWRSLIGARTRRGGPANPRDAIPGSGSALHLIRPQDDPPSADHHRHEGP